MRILDKEQALLDLDTLGMRDELARALRDGLPPGLRRRARDRPDRLRQVDHALRRAQRDQLDREEHHHDRGPGRVPARRASTRSRSTSKAGLTFAARPALDAARRPRRDHGRRDPRRRDGADRDRVGADRPPRALDAAHQRRAVGDHAPDRDGHRAVPDRLRARLRRRPAPRAAALHLLQAAHGADGRRAARRPASTPPSTSRPTSRSAARAAAAPATRAASASTR